MEAFELIFQQHSEVKINKFKIENSMNMKFNWNVFRANGNFHPITECTYLLWKFLSWIEENFTGKGQFIGCHLRGRRFHCLTHQLSHKIRQRNKFSGSVEKFFLLNIFRQKVFHLCWKDKHKEKNLQGLEKQIN